MSVVRLLSVVSISLIMCLICLIWSFTQWIILLTYTSPNVSYSECAQLPPCACHCLHADSSTDVFNASSLYLLDLEFPVREGQQTVDREALKLSTKANHVSSVAVSRPPVPVSACCRGPNPVNLRRNALITILKLLHRAPGTAHRSAGLLPHFH